MEKSAERQSLIEQEKLELEQRLHQLQDENTKLRQQLIDISNIPTLEIINSTQDGFFILDRDWRIVYMDCAAEVIRGVEPGELIGKNFWESSPELLNTPIEKQLREAMALRRPLQLESQCLISDRCYSQSIIPYKDGISVYYSDCTEKKRVEQALQESEKQYRDLVKYAPTGIYSVDFKERRFTSVNEAICLVTGYSREELLQKDPFDMINTQSQQLFANRIASWLAGEKPDPNVEYKVITKDGREIDALLDVTFQRDEKGFPSGATVVCHDITERKKMEQVLQKYAERLEQSNRDLEHFAIIASHNLQEPLRKIISFGERVKFRLGDQVDEESRDFLDRIHVASERMQKMIEGLLEMSRITTRGQPPERVNLNLVVGAVLFDLEQLIQESGAQVVATQLPEIMADQVQMHQLLQNLIVNAIKFQPPGGVPRVRLFAEGLPPVPGDNQGMVKIFVEDNGIGFDDQNAERIFQPFERLVGRSEYEGSGIGLAICKKIVDRHGGSITAQSKPGEGSTFIVSLPL